jgi:hypothetical protein
MTESMNDYRVYLSPNQIKKLQSCKEKRIDCNIRFDLTERPNNTIKLREKQVDKIKKCKKEKKKYCDIKFSPTQIPRCGVKDNPTAYRVHYQKWNKTNLKWYFSLATNEMKELAQKAFDNWNLFQI